MISGAHVLLQDGRWLLLLLAAGIVSMKKEKTSQSKILTDRLSKNIVERIFFPPNCSFKQLDDQLLLVSREIFLALVINNNPTAINSVSVDDVSASSPSQYWVSVVLNPDVSMRFGPIRGVVWVLSRFHSTVENVDSGEQLLLHLSRLWCVYFYDNKEENMIEKNLNN